MSKRWGNGNHAEKAERDRLARLVLDLSGEITERLVEHGPSVMRHVAAHIVSIALAGTIRSVDEEGRHILWHDQLRRFNNLVIGLAEAHYQEIRKHAEENDDD